jgi:hemerythrin-like domain-containing protein
MDALTLLTDHHRRIKALITAIERTQDTWKKRLFDQVENELQVHEHIEQTIFYPAIRQHEPLEQLVGKTLDEHKQFETLLEELERLPSIHPQFTSKFQLLRTNVEQHISQEEGEMFPKVREVLDAAALEELGSHMQEVKHNGD